MKITHNKVGQNLNLVDSQKAERSGKSTAEDALKQAASSSESSSKVSLSDRAQKIKKAKELAQQAPDIRQDKVAQLQKMIDEGKYNVPAKDIADKMVDEELQWL